MSALLGPGKLTGLPLGARLRYMKAPGDRAYQKKAR
jgi:hypothetical protein